MIARRLAVLALIALPGGALAQASQCTPPQRLPRPQPDGPGDAEPARRLPIGGYTLALSWSPQACRTPDAARRDPLRCGPRAAGRFGFTLHGLWPDGRGKAWPQYCTAVSLLPERVIRDHICATPSVQLLQHEWAKHGSCMGTTPAAYFSRSTALYRQVRYPDMRALSRRPALTVGQFAAAFASANPGMDAAMLRVTVDRRGWLDEVWLCLDTGFHTARCPAHQGGAAARARLKIWRDG